MHEVKERKDGQRWWVMPRFVNFDKTKPIVDEQGRALEKLEQVHFNDMMGPLADKALFLMGSVKFFNEDYKEADHYFSQLVERHPNSTFAAQAVDLAIHSKTLCTGGADYDGVKVAEARILVHKALENYPELAAKKAEYLNNQLQGITLQQAQKEFNQAEFYNRTGHPESAYFIYEIVRRRYVGTKYANLAYERMLQLHGAVEKAQAEQRDKANQPGQTPKTLSPGLEDGAPLQTLPEGPH
jgi:outer membrane protein assembly factor BamD (BamD/ComL family)